MSAVKIMIPPRAGSFSDTAHPFASLQRRNPCFAFKQSSLRALRFRGESPEKIPVRFRDPMFELRKGFRMKKDKK